MGLINNVVEGAGFRDTANLDAAKVRYLVIHCSGTRVTRDFTEEQLVHEHVGVRHWLAVGYHFYVRKDGSLTQFRTLQEQGAHCRPWNDRSIGICYEGGLDADGNYADTLTEAQFAVISRLIGELRGYFPNAVTVGHRDLPKATNKACPCFDAAERFKAVSLSRENSESGAKGASG